MTALPEVLRLAELMETDGWPEAAAELRRLYQLAMDQQGELYALNMARSMEQKTAALKRGALLKALKMIAGEAPCIDNLMSDKDIARAIERAHGIGTEGRATLTKPCGSLGEEV